MSDDHPPIPSVIWERIRASLLRGGRFILLPRSADRDLTRLHALLEPAQPFSHLPGCALAEDGRHGGAEPASRRRIGQDHLHLGSAAARSGSEVNRACVVHVRIVYRAPGDEPIWLVAHQLSVPFNGDTGRPAGNPMRPHAVEPRHRLQYEKITRPQLERTFRTNVFGMFFITRAAVRHLRAGSSIINTTSVTAYRGSHHLIDYAATKGAIVSFTRSLAQALAKKQIRVNAVAPGPIWTPLIASTFPRRRVATFGSDVPLGRAGEPNEVAPSYVFLASDDAVYMTGQVLHPNGGEIVNG